MAEPAAEPLNAPNLNLRLVEPGDERAILKLHKIVYRTPLDPGLLRWKIRSNIDRLAANGFEGYGAGVVVVKDNQIVGFNSYQTRQMRYRGHEILAAESGTTMASPETRGMHMFSRMIQFAGNTLGACGVPFIYGVFNQCSEAPALKSGFLNVGGLRLFSLQPGRIRRALAAMTNRKKDFPGPADQPGLPEMNSEQLIADFAPSENPALHSGFDIELVRDAAGWRRRYADHPTLTYHLVRCGATVFVLRLNPRLFGKTASICDLAPIPPTSADALLPGFDALMAILKQWRIEVVDCWAGDGSAMGGFLERAGFTPSPVARFPILMFPTSNNPLPLSDASLPFFIAGDFDIV